MEKEQFEFYKSDNVCSVCGSEMLNIQAEFTKETSGKPLCLEHEETP